MEVTHVTHVPWRTRLFQSVALVGLLAGIAVLARAPTWGNRPEQVAAWRPPHIEVLNEARELTLDVSIVPGHGEPGLKTRGGPEVTLTAGDAVDIAMRNRSEREVYVAVFTVNAANAVTWLVPQGGPALHGEAVRTGSDKAPQPLAHAAIGADTPTGRLDIVGMFFNDPTPVAEIVAALHDGGMTALHNMQHVVLMDTVPTTVRAQEATETQ